MTADPLATVEHLDRRGAEARPEFLSDEGMRHAVIVAVDIDVIIEGGAHTFPLGIHVRGRWQRTHRGAVERLEHRAPRSRQLLERPIVQSMEQRADRGIEFLQAEEALMPQTREYPTTHQ